jgi:phage terminase large subunit
MAATRVVIPYAPRPQFLPFHNRKERWAVLVVHRRGGKTVACINDLLRAAVTSPKERPRFAYIAPQLKQAKTVAWDYLKHYGLRVPGATAHESELRLDLPNGGQVRLHGSDNPDALRGIYLDGLVMDEAADVSPRLFNEILRPALSDRQGWCVWIGTPKGQNDFFDLWQTARHEPERYFTLMLRASQTGLVNRDELEDARRMMTPEQYAQEYECSFSAAIVGAYYGREMQAAEDEGRITRNLYDPGMEVHTSWDLGASDHTVIWFFQQSGFDVRWIDFYASNGYGFDHYAEVLQKKRYRYGRHYFPHDVAQTHIGAGYVAKSRKETLEGLGIPVQVGVKVKDPSERINVTRRVLPRSWFDADTCDEGIKALRQYRRHWDDVRKVFLERPLHDWTSHPADAFGEGCMGLQEPTTANTNMPKRQMSWVV